MFAAWTLAAVVLVGAGAPSAAGESREVVLRAAPPTEPAMATEVLDRLSDGEVLRIRVDDGIADVAGSARQCATPSGDRCFNAFPVQFDDDGVAWLQYQLDDRGECGPADSCVVIISDASGERIAIVATVFAAPAPPPPAVSVTPDAPYRSGTSVRVAVAGAVPGTPVEVTLCGLDCGPTSSSLADPSGATSTRVTIGSDCRNCRITVANGVHTTNLPIEFQPARYDERRLIAGLLAAAALLIVAWRIIVAVDWRPPSEAYTPDLDAAELDNASSWD